ncbi:floral homeotic protein AGAMOUS [Heracleum sosnowskyi]|uniref:Floral homeotic protein AGAMOUS n=1 Tax=Heracleum sosnowskyi TaxID=360622 RepID=A0AAD8MXX6_9APIA|nr:floral homeotic protein AGAMOUS [Heracleum sosnowskyi]
MITITARTLVSRQRRRLRFTLHFVFVNYFHISSSPPNLHISYLSLPAMEFPNMYQDEPESSNNQMRRAQQQLEQQEGAGRVALIVFSSRGRLYEYANNSVRSTIDRYKKTCADTSNIGSASEANTQFYQQEASKLRREIKALQNSNRNIVGEGLGSLTFKELKNLEGKLEKAIGKIRSRKNETLFAEIELMQKREIELQHANMYLRAKISENERMQQHMSLMPGGSSHHQYQHQQSMAPDSHPAAYNHDARNFLPVNLMQPNHHDDQYSSQDQTVSLQLV